MTSGDLLCTTLDYCTHKQMTVCVRAVYTVRQQRVGLPSPMYPGVVTNNGC